MRVALLLLLGVVPAVGAQESPRAIVERAVAAHGGHEKLSRARADVARMRGIIHIGKAAVPFTSEVTVQLPKKYHSVVQLQNGDKMQTLIHDLDGDKVTITIDGTVIDGYKVSGGIQVRAQNVVIKNSWITHNTGGSNGSGVINVNPGYSATIDHNVLDGSNATHACIWNEGRSMTATANECVGVNDGIFSWASQVGADGTGEQMEAVMRVLLRTLTKVNANTATAAQLALALDVSEATALAVVKYRAEHGKFKSLADLTKVPGINAAKLDARKDRVAF